MTREHQVGKAAAGLDVAPMHGLHAVAELPGDRLRASAAVANIALEAAFEAHGFVGVDEDREVDPCAQFGLAQAQDSVEQNHGARFHTPGDGAPCMRREVVNGNLDRAACDELVELFDQQRRLEFAGLVVISGAPRLGVRIGMIPVIGVVREHERVLGPEFADQPLHEGRLSGATAARDPDHERLSGCERCAHAAGLGFSSNPLPEPEGYTPPGMSELPDRSQTRIAAAGGGLFWALAGAGVCALAIPLEPNLLEEGLTLHIAQRIAAGEFLYRDMLAFTGPVPFEFLGLVFRILGPDLMLGRWIDVALHGSACAASFGIARRAGAGPLAHAVAAPLAAAPVLLFPLFALFFYTTVAVHLCILSAYAAVRGLRSPGWALAAGCGVALAALSKQTIGAVLVVGLFASLALCVPRERRLRVLAGYLAGGAAVVLATLALYGARGDLAALLRGLVVLPLLLGDSFAAPYLNLWPIGDFSEAVRPNSRLYLPTLYAHTHGILEPIDAWIIPVAQALYALPIVALVATLLARWRRPLHAAVWIHAALVIALFSNSYPRGDWGHLVFVLPASLAQLVLLLPVHARRTAWALTGTLVIALAVGVGLATDLLYGLAVKSNYGARVAPRPVSALLKTPGAPMVIYFLEKWARPDEPIFVARSEPLIYFATGRTNPTPYSGVVPGIREEQERTILEALRNVRFVVMSDIDQPVYTYYREELPAVQKYLERHYHPAGRQGMNWILLLARRPDRGPTAIDLFDRQVGARVWVRDADGLEIPPPRELPKLATRLNRRPLPMLLGPGGGGIDFELELPERALFEADLGIEGLVGLDNLYRHPRDSTLVVSVRTQDGFEEAARFRPLPAKKRQLFWEPVRADLSRWGGSRVTLRLELVPGRKIDPEELAWWGSPRIIVAPEAN